MVAYLALLQISYGFLEGRYSLPPQWWRDHLHPRSVAIVSWFVLLDAAPAILAAIPIAIGVVFLVKTRKLAMGIMVGVPPSLYIVGSGLFEYGLPKYVAAWLVDVFQFLSIGVAVPVAVMLFSTLPLTIGWSDRGSRLR
jgi:hypothetical protein